MSWTSADRAEWIAKYRLTFTRSKNGGPEEPFAVSGGGNTLEMAGTVTQTTLRPKAARSLGLLQPALRPGGGDPGRALARPGPGVKADLKTFCQDHRA